MAERTSPRRVADDSLHGDANIIDFLAQQQGAADLSDFALQSNAGATLGGAVYADGAALSPLMPENTVAGIGTNSGGTFSLDSTVTPPGGAGTSILYTPLAGSFSNVLVIDSVAVPTTPYMRFTGWVQHHFVSKTMQFNILVTFTDEAGLLLTRSPVRLFTDSADSLGPFDVVFSVDATNGDTWIPIDAYIAVPAGAARAGVQIDIYPPATGTYGESDVTYLNGFQFEAASSFVGSHSGLVTPPAAWWLPWGLIAYSQVTANQSGIGTAAALLTGLRTNLPVTPPSNRWYSIRGQVIAQTSSTGLLTLQIVDGVTTTRLAEQEILASTANANVGLQAERILRSSDFTATASLRLKGPAVGSTTMVAAADVPAFIAIEDLGPCGPPPADLV
jgi:hypothetical protein